MSTVYLSICVTFIFFFIIVCFLTTGLLFIRFIPRHFTLFDCKWDCFLNFFFPPVLFSILLLFLLLSSLISLVHQLLCLSFPLLLSPDKNSILDEPKLCLLFICTNIALHSRRNINKRSSGEGNGNPLQYLYLENPMVRGAWQAMVHKVAKSQTQLKWLSMDVSKFIVTDLRQTLPIAPQSSSFLTMLSLPHSQSPFHTSPCCSHLTFFLPTHYPLILSDLLRTSLSRLKNPCFKAGFFNSTVYAATASVMSDSVRPHRWQPTRFPRPWDSPGKNTGVVCHFLL